MSPRLTRFYLASVRSCIYSRSVLITCALHDLNRSVSNRRQRLRCDLPAVSLATMIVSRNLRKTLLGLGVVLLLLLLALYLFPQQVLVLDDGMPQADIIV